MLDDAVDRLAFESYVACILVPELQIDDIVIIDNLSAHKIIPVTVPIEIAGVRLT